MQSSAYAVHVHKLLKSGPDCGQRYSAWSSSMAQGAWGGPIRRTARKPQTRTDSLQMHGPVVVQQSTILHCYFERILMQKIDNRMPTPNTQHNTHVLSRPSGLQLSTSSVVSGGQRSELPSNKLDLQGQVCVSPATPHPSGDATLEHPSRAVCETDPPAGCTTIAASAYKHPMR